MYMSDTHVYSIKTKYENEGQSIDIKAYNYGEDIIEHDTGHSDDGSEHEKTIDELIDSASLQEPYKFYSTNNSNEDVTMAVTESGEGMYYNNTTSKSKSYFWVEDLKNWCRYKIDNNYVDYVTPNTEKLPYGISFKLQVWNGSNGWLDIDDNGNVNTSNDINKIYNIQKNLVERLILPAKNRHLDNWDIASINKISQSRGNVEYFDLDRLDPNSAEEYIITARKVQMCDSISSTVREILKKHNILEADDNCVEGLKTDIYEAFDEIDANYNDIKINVYIKVPEGIIEGYNTLKAICQGYNVALDETYEGTYYYLKYTGRYSDIFKRMIDDGDNDYNTFIRENNYTFEYHATDAKFPGSRLLDCQYIKAKEISKNKQIVKGFKLQKVVNYCINTNVDFQTYRYILSQSMSNYATAKYFENTEHRTVSYTGVPPIWRLPTGEVFLSTNFECNTDVGMTYYRCRPSREPKAYKVRPLITEGEYESSSSTTERNSVELTSFVSSIYADNITQFETEINNKIGEYFGTGKDKTIKKDWLREYSITKVINTETDYINMLDSNLVFEQVNSNDNADLKCTLKVNRPNIVTDEYEPVEYVKKW